MILSIDIKKKEKYLDEIKSNREEVSKQIALFEKQISSPEMRNIFNEFVNENEKYKILANKSIELIMQDKDEEARAFISPEGEAGKQAKLLETKIQDLIDKKIVEAKAKSDSNTAQAD
jgi:methyl-accepting chemotaxis protein